MQGHRPRKRFGQHFLADSHYVARIVTAIDPQSGENLVEIGPGLGALTGALIDRAQKIAAIEIDRDLAARLRERYAADRLALYETDALRFDFALLGAALRVVGNLPYNISSPLLFHLASFESQLRDIHVMLQREVVARMTAAPATRDYGRLSVMLQVRFRVTRLFTVPAGAFRPAPKVLSALVRLRFHRPDPPVADPIVLAGVVQAVFTRRRKTLANALRAYEPAARGSIARVLSAAALDGGRRPETLTVAEFARLADAL